MHPTPLDPDFMDGKPEAADPLEGAPALKKFLGAYEKVQDTYRNMSETGRIMALVWGTAGIAVGGAAALSYAANTREETKLDALIAQNSSNGVYIMPFEDYSVSQVMDETGPWLTKDRVLPDLPDRMSPAAVKSLPTRVERTQALASVASEQVPSFASNSMAIFGASYHLDAADLAALASTKPVGERGIFDIPGFSEEDVREALKMSDDYDNLTHATSWISEKSGRGDVRKRLKSLPPEKVASFAATFGEEEAKKIVAVGGDMNQARNLGRLALAGMHSLYLQRSPLIDQVRDHPVEWRAMEIAQAAMPQKDAGSERD